MADYYRLEVIYEKSADGYVLLPKSIFLFLTKIQ